jgi:hypothetical protein
MKNILGKSQVFSAGLLLAMAMAGSASAATITFGHQVATDGSSKTSQFVNADNTINLISDGYFIETFDTATAITIPGFPVPPNTTYNVAGASTGCAINSPLMLTTVPSPGVVNVRKGSVASVAAAPAGDTTCYAYTTPVAPGQNYVELDYTAFLVNIGTAEASLAGSYIDYLGFYWGSVDRYNTFEFYSDSGLVKSITGTQLLNQLGGTSGDQTSDKSNVYVNISFSPAEAFNKVRVITTGIAGEFDNIVVGLNKRPPPSVPAPTGLALLGLGLIGLGFTRRFKK